MDDQAELHGDTAAASWAEIECPRCGIDFDFEPWPMPGEVLPVCGCGYEYTARDFAGANFYRRGFIAENPFKNAAAQP